MNSRLAIGTVQFGLAYGITNRSGQVSREAGKDICDFARSSGIDMLDTAIGYGESEACLGDIGIDDFKVVTKLPSIPDNVTDVGVWVSDQMQASFERLNVTKIYGLLLHRSQQLLGPKGEALAQAICQFKSQGSVQKIGVSIYAPWELDALMDVCQIDLVQAPFSLVDQRLKTSGWLEKLYKTGVEVHVRSVFLQGLLLMHANKVKVLEKFERWQPLFDTLGGWLLANNMSAAQACIGFVQAHPQIAKIVVGVESKNQLKQLVRAEKQLSNIVWPDINCLDEDLIDPSNWNSL